MGRLKFWLVLYAWLAAVTWCMLAPLSGAEIDVYKGVVLTAEVDCEVRSYLWFVNAPDRSWVPVVAEEDGKRVRFREGDLKQPGIYLVLLVMITPDGNALQAVGQFEIKSSNDSPDPPLPPPMNVSRLWIIRKTGRMTPAVGAIANNKAWKDAAKASGVDYLVTDDNELAKSEPAITKRARNSGLPCVLFLDDAKNILIAKDLPATPQAMLNLVKKYGGRK